MPYLFGPRTPEPIAIESRPHLRFIRIAMVCTLICIGCDGTHSSTPVRPSRPDENSATSPLNPDASLTPIVSKTEDEASDTSAESVKLDEANWADLQTLISEHKSKIVVVDIWSTACAPCMKELPHLISLQNKHPDDIVAISFDVDYDGNKKKPVSYYRERVTKFLSSMGPSHLKHLMCTTPADELFQEIHLDSIPAIYVYDRDGKLAKRFDGSKDGEEGVSYAKQVNPFVENLLKSSDR